MIQNALKTIFASQQQSGHTLVVRKSNDSDDMWYALLVPPSHPIDIDGENVEGAADTPESALLALAYELSSDGEEETPEEPQY